MPAPAASVEAFAQAQAAHRGDREALEDDAGRDRGQVIADALRRAADRANCVGA
jgi:hypothetical protein